MDYAAAAIEQMKHYCAAHPGSPSAVRCRQLLFRGDPWIRTARPKHGRRHRRDRGRPSGLRSAHLTCKYLAELRPPNEMATNSTKPHRFFRSASAAAD